MTSLAKPVYIIGTDALACYLAARFQDAGEQAVIIAAPAEIKSLGTNGVSIKEEFSTLKKKHYTFETTFWIRNEPQAVFFTTTPDELNAALSSVSTDKLGTAPVVCFSLLKNSGCLQDILGTPVNKAHFSGWLIKNDQQIILKGRQPQITFYSPLSKQTEKKLTHLFAPAKLPLNFAPSENDFFWQTFALQSACGLLCTAGDKTIAQILKNKPLTDRLKELLNEFARLAAADGVTLSVDQIMKNIIAIPGGYVFPLHADFRTGRHRGFSQMYDIIAQTARRAGTRIPLTSSLLDRIYEIYLSIT